MLSPALLHKFLYDYRSVYYFYPVVRTGYEERVFCLGAIETCPKNQNHLSLYTFMIVRPYKRFEKSFLHRQLLLG